MVDLVISTAHNRPGSRAMLLPRGYTFTTVQPVTHGSATIRLSSRGEEWSMPDHKRRDSLLPAMNRRAFLATMGGAAGSIGMGPALPGLRASARQPAGATPKPSAPRPQPT